MEYNLDYKTAADKTGLLPILDQSAPTNVTKQVQQFPIVLVTGALHIHYRSKVLGR